MGQLFQFFSVLLLQLSLFFDGRLVLMIFLRDELQFLPLHLEDGLDFSIISDEFPLTVGLSLDDLLNIILPMPQLLQFLSLDDQTLHILLIQSLLSLNQLRIRLQLIFQLMQFLNNLIIALLGGIDVLLSFLVELGDLGVNQF